MLLVVSVQSNQPNKKATFLRYSSYILAKEIKKMERRRLYRSNSDRMIAGVCGGLADFFNIDPSVMRIIFVLFLLLGGNGLLIYLVLWLIVPLEPTT
jgi:phage shock protein C